MIKNVKKFVNYVSVFRPRLMHLQAYYSTLTRSPSRATYLAKKSAEIAEKMGNLLECDWVNHNVEVQLNRRRLLLSRDFQGSHSTWKTWKTWKNKSTPGKPGNIMEF